MENFSSQQELKRGGHHVIIIILQIETYAKKELQRWWLISESLGFVIAACIDMLRKFDAQTAG